jgi:hypothetical protein
MLKICNKKAQGTLANFLAGVFTTMVIIFILFIFYLSSLFFKVGGDTQALNLDFAVKAQEHVSLNYFLQSEIEKSEVTDMIQNWNVTGNTEWLKSNVSEILTKLEYEYTDLIEKDQRIRGYNIFVGDNLRQDYVRGFGVYSKNYNLCTKDEKEQCLFSFIELPVSGNGMLYIRFYEGQAKKSRGILLPEREAGK